MREIQMRGTPACGVDLVEIASVVRAIELGRERFVRRVYTERELAYCRDRPPRLAASFAAKEAVVKALGTGSRGIGWREIEILPNSLGQPTVTLSGRAAARAQGLGLSYWMVSLAYSRQLVIATVVASASPEPESEGSALDTGTRVS